ncbi:WYL domain-containing protein [Gilvimarinus sp. SDUM040013]|uniref:WYL domain-containing protein n=1 Tax=Gilvimarinus gilvus TaxID=3058038 RepID=A0ABU4RYG7_9GAMM|nr:WYL domain-containing protein [Gilvimarinus sp. SDUM040013]MDO3387941.1 WYL domain-containing protein [Gilvimarinus sp. SDUM040013]MDX6848688.1 WYL domain-containing protein [Gilvimarinus sp. SDUM040013]
MEKQSVNTRLHRLDELLGLLKSGDQWTAMRLAHELSVSRRTLMRDLKLLRDRGYLIEADNGRGGGLRLAARSGIGRLNLDYREILELLLALSVMEKMPPSLFFGRLQSIRRKIFQAFPEKDRHKLTKLRKRLLVGAQASKHVQTDMAPMPSKVSALLEGFFECRIVTIDYENAKGEASTRPIEIHYLLTNWPAWYLICWDQLRNETRCFRVDRVVAVRVERQGFTPKSIALFRDCLDPYSTHL